MTTETQPKRRYIATVENGHPQVVDKWRPNPDRRTYRCVCETKTLGMAMKIARLLEDNQ